MSEDSGGLALAFVAHELRAPLGLVVTAARTANEVSEPEFLRRQLQVIERSAERLLRISSVLLSAAAPARTGRFQLDRTLAATIEDLQGLGLNVELQGELPANLSLPGAAEHFEALVSSLVMNAADHGDARAPIVVSVMKGADGDRALTVRIENKVAVEAQHRGRGLGMLIARQLAAQLCAELEITRSGPLFTTDIRFVTRL